LAVTTVCVALAWYVHITRKYQTVRIEIEPTGVYVDSWTASRDLFESLASCAKQVEASQVPVASADVVIVVNDAATYGMFREVVEACWETGFRRFYLERDASPMPFEASGVPSDAANPLSPLPILLRAGADGQLAEVRIAPGRRYDAGNGFPVLELSSLVQDFLKDDTAPDNLRGKVSVALKAEDGLQFYHVAAVLDVVGPEYRSSSRRPLFKNVILAIVGLNVAVFDEDESLTAAFDYDYFGVPRPPLDYQYDHVGGPVVPLEEVEADRIRNEFTRPEPISGMEHLTVPVPRTRSPQNARHTERRSMGRRGH
jgi:hypothetical protein